jgi:hypothetical protein
VTPKPAIYADGLRVTRRLDRVGAGASTMCAIHCALMPIVATSLPLIGLGWLSSPLVEGLLIGLGLSVASIALARGYIRHHRRAEALGVGMAGAAAILAARFALPEEMEPFAMATGGLLLAAAHLVNSRLCATTCCGTEKH